LDGSGTLTVSLVPILPAGPVTEVLVDAHKAGG
jgi:hypothetical protein